eukprot:5253327-Amphidinium_carterae.1
MLVLWGMVCTSQQNGMCNFRSIAIKVDGTATFGESNLMRRAQCFRPPPPPLAHVAAGDTFSAHL